jgi:hypothetical protein
VPAKHTRDGLRLANRENWKTSSILIRRKEQLFQWPSSRPPKNRVALTGWMLRTPHTGRRARPRKGKRAIRRTPSVGGFLARIDSNSLFLLGYKRDLINPLSSQLPTTAKSPDASVASVAFFPVIARRLLIASGQQQSGPQQIGREWTLLAGNGWAASSRNSWIGCVYASGRGGGSWIE